MALNALPVEVIAQLLNAAVSVAPAAPILLWQCGNLLLNCKLQRGCRALALTQEQSWYKSAHLPRLLQDGAFQQLTHLKLICGFPIATTTLHHVAPTLISLRLTCPNISDVVHGLDYAAKWPMLQSLRLAHTTHWDRPKNMTNFLSLLPPTITELETPEFADATLMQVLQSLPAGITSFYYSQIRTLASLLNDTSKRAVLELLKTTHPLIQDLELGEYWRIDSDDDIEMASLLPVQLSGLQLYYHSNRPIILPPHLKALSINAANSIDHDTWLQIPSSVTRLSLIDFGPYYTTDKLFTPEQWRVFLPPRLVQFKTIVTLLPLQWSIISRDVCIWPATLQSLDIRLLYSSMLELLALPPSIRNVTFHIVNGDTLASSALKGMMTAEKTPCLQSLDVNFDIYNHVVQTLPPTLTRLESVGPRSSSLCDAYRDYRGLSSLKKLKVNARTLQYPILLPDSLQTLIGVYQNDRMDACMHLCSKRQTQRLFESLPCGLATFEIQGGYLDTLEPDLIQLLPPRLQTLNVTCVNLIHPETIIGALPRGLTSLNLSLQPLYAPIAKIAVYFDHVEFVSRMPPRLKHLRVVNCLFNQFNTDYPIPSLQTVHIDVNTKAKGNDNYEFLFPNAHKIGMDYK